MQGPGELWRRLIFLLESRRFHREMEEELRFHLERKAEKNGADGMDAEEAHYAARRRLGNLMRLESESRNAWGWAAVDHLFQDARFALRGLVRNPTFSLIVVFTFACGIGVNSAIFSAVNALLLNPYPFPRADRIVSVSAHHISGKNQGTGWRDYQDWLQQNAVFDSMAINPWNGGYTLTGMGEPQRITGGETTPDFLRVLGIEPALGRFFRPEETLPGAPQVAVLTHATWQSRFSGSADVLGRTLMLNGRPFTIIGVLPSRFAFPGMQTVEFYAPLRDTAQSRYQHQYEVIARLKDDVSIARAQSDMSAIAARLERDYPATNKGWGIEVRPLREVLAQEARMPVLVLFPAVGFVLLLACVTVAGLLFARASGRAKEIAVRASLGATRGRILRQMLTECLILSLLGGVAGIALAVWLINVLRAAAPAYLGLDATLHLNNMVLAFTATISVIAGLLSGLWPGWHISGVDPDTVLKSDGDAWCRARSRKRWMFWLVASEAGLAVVLMNGAGLLARSLVRELNTDTGIASENVLTFALELPQARYSDQAQSIAFYRELLGRLRSIPGVDHAAAVMTLPMTGDFTGGSFQVEGRSKAADWVDTIVQYNTVTPGYFQAMGIRLLRGRDFDQRDTAASPPVAIVNDTLARQFFPNEDPIGHRYRDDYDGKWRTIVGVVTSVKNQMPMYPPDPGVFAPHAQKAERGMWITMKGRGDPVQLASVARITVHAMDNQLPLLHLRSMREVVSDALEQPRMLTSFLSGFAAFALLLSAIGAYGIVEYSARQRTREVGIRMALGASRWRLAGLVLRTGIAPAAAGVAVGIPAALSLSGVLRSLLYGISPRDVGVFLLVPVVLIMVAFVASAVPARRAVRLDAMTALRSE